jgi:hypothetical protein
MVEIHRGRGHHEIVMLAPCIGKALCQIANLVFVNIDEGSDTILALAGLFVNLMQTGPYEVPKSLRTALIAARLDEVESIVSEAEDASGVIVQTMLARVCR